MPKIGKEKPSKVIPAFADPVKFVGKFWPDINLYNKQREILYSIRDNYETIVPAAHELGKDFIAGLGILWFFCSRRPCRILTTSPNATQLEDVLWGEIRSFVETSKFPLPIELMQDMRIYQKTNKGGRVPKTEVLGAVYKKPDSMMGRHVPRTPNGEPTTMLVVDEGSGCDDEGYKRADSWTHRKLVIGNPYECTNFFFTGTMAGDRETKRTNVEKLHRKVIKIKGEDSPNVRYALKEIQLGKEVSHTNLIPGVLTYADYIQRRDTWDPIRQCVGIDAEFYRGKENYMFPPEWLNLAETTFETEAFERRVALGIGIDPAEGGDSTCFAAVDEYGLIELEALKTPDTSEIKRRTLAFMRKHGLDPGNKRDCNKVVFDRGGGGKEHADYLRNTKNSENGGRGYRVRTIGFGQPATAEPKHGTKTVEEQKVLKEQSYTYVNKRAELYGRLRQRINPDYSFTKFSYSAKYTKLREQLDPIPLSYDEEGRLKLPPKRKKKNAGPLAQKSLIELIGYSPDEADAVALAVYGMEVKGDMPSGGVLF